MPIKLLMEWIVVLIGICVFSGTSSYACKDGRFWGHCQRNELCVCVNNNWCQTTTNEIEKIDSSISSFSQICSCPDPIQADECRSNHLYEKILSHPEFNETLELTDETTCRQLLTGDSSTLPSTGKHETTFMTVSNVHTVQNQATAVDDSTTLSSTEKLESTFITSANEQIVENQATSVAMCPCNCEYFDKIVYWSQEANQIKQYNELSQQLAHIKNILKMETKNLTSYLNKKKSVNDKRPSARATGYLGGVILVLILCFIVLLDIVKFFREMLMDKEHVRTFSHEEICSVKN